MTRDEFKIIFDTYFDEVRNYVYYRSGDKEIATDIAQDVFTRIWEKRQKLTTDIKGLLFKIASDAFISGKRKEQNKLLFNKTFQLDYSVSTTEESIFYNELKDKYELALTKLPEKQRVVFLMSRIDNLKYNEIAERLKLSTKAVEKRMSQALNFLRQEIEN